MADFRYDDFTDRSDSEPMAENLTCSVCKDIFTEPVLLSCSHSFCRTCLEASWENKTTHNCPVCRKNCNGETPINNRDLNNACVTYKRQRVHSGKSSGENLCGLHQCPLTLFCMKDEEPVCVVCVSSHPEHRLVSIEEGVPLAKSQTKEAEEKIKQEFERLHQALYEEEKSRMIALSTEEKEKTEKMKNKIQTLAADISALADLLKSVKRQMGAEDLVFLQVKYECDIDKLCKYLRRKPF
ncbi:hypothetical protein DNTS_001312 [Danionella cerebrum]|uniref:RING-type domain-containing protein n=1 Tax=Danionella cerebrum TaxID=2873325 RepID=A0A553Q3Q8_9TELE|nr:hypothetical protein DNTS_001312 [Danionella translucida]